MRINIDVMQGRLRYLNTTSAVAVTPAGRGMINMTLMRSARRLNLQIGNRIRRGVSRGRTSKLRGRDCLYAVETINGGVWRGFQPPKSLPHDTLHRSLAG